MKILVTGGAGFVGSHIVERLLKRGGEVVIVDNINPYYDPALKRARLASLCSGANMYEVDIADADALEAVFKSHSFDLIYHIAAQAGVRYSLSHPEVYVRTNVVGTENVLKLACAYGKPPVIFASSSSVYGDIKAPIFMEDETGTALSPYAETKQKGEALCEKYAKECGLNITALRFFTVYGPWGRPDMAPILFTEKILKGEPIEIFNEGDMKRDFTYIDDIVDGCILAGENPNGFRVFNLGRGAPVALLDFVSILEKELGVTAHIIKKPMQPGDMKETYASISKAQKELGFDPKIQLESGVRQFVKWYRQYHNVSS